MREHLRESEIPLFVCSVWGRFSVCGMNRVLSNHFIFPLRCLCTARENDSHESLAILPEVFPFRYPVWHSFFSLFSWDDIQIFRTFGVNHVDWKSSFFFTTLLSGPSYSHFIVEKKQERCQKRWRKTKRRSCLCSFKITVTLLLYYNSKGVIDFQV